MKTHLRDIRLRNNAGMDFPVCQAGARLLDTDKGRWPTTGEWSAVTCLKCLKQAPKAYPWAYAHKQQGVAKSP
jgi:hypothetical protein